MNITNITNGDIIDHLNETLLLHINDNLRLYIAQTCEFGIADIDVANNFNNKQYIHAGDWVILMNSDKALMYKNLQGSTNKDPYNIIHVIINWDHQWESPFTNNEL